MAVKLSATSSDSMQFGIFSGHPAGGFNLVMTGGCNERVAASGGKQAINITPRLLIT